MVETHIYLHKRLGHPYIIYLRFCALCLSPAHICHGPPHVAREATSPGASPRTLASVRQKTADRIASLLDQTAVSEISLVSRGP